MAPERVQDRLLHSIVEITRHRDLDSLELAFVATLKEMLPVRALSLYHVRDDGLETVEEVISLDDERELAAHRWQDGPRVVPAGPRLRAALASLKPASAPVGDGLVEWIMPIVCGDRPNGAVVLVGKASLADRAELIEGLARVYSNYMTILHEAEHDRLTGLLNRRTFDDSLDRLLRVQRRHAADADHTAWLAVLDIDHFKRINDTYGHVYGDEILLLIAQEMRAYFAPADLLFRVGGEEFVIVLAPRSGAAAHGTLEAFRERVAGHLFPQGLRVTVSIGYAPLGRSEFPKQAYGRADKALYAAKEQGRNRVASYQRLLAAGDFQESDASGSIELF